MKIDHPNVMKVYSLGHGLYKVKGKEDVSMRYMEMELAQNKSLFDYVSETGPFSESMAAHFFSQLVQGLLAIHTSGICNRDLKCENVLIDHNYQMRITDFGLSAPIEGREGDGILNTNCGSEQLYAPEIL